MGDDTGTYFFNQLNKYAQVDWIKANSITEYKEKLKEYELTIIGFHKSNANPWKEYKFSDYNFLIRKHSVKINRYSKIKKKIQLNDTMTTRKISKKL